VPTARSWTEPVGELGRCANDVGTLARFRLTGLRGRARFAPVAAVAVLGVISVAAAVVPALLPEQDISRRQVLSVLPDGLLGLLVVAVMSAAASGGGREILSREQAVAFPVSPITDHLGALLMTPLNTAWLLQTWSLLAAVSYGVTAGPALLPGLVAVLLWVLAATCLAQVLGWGVEWVRRGPYGVLLVRCATGVGAALVAAMVATHRVSSVLAHNPTGPVAAVVGVGATGRWLATVSVLLALLVVSVGVGAWAAGRVGLRPVREELRTEAAARPARPNPASDLVAMMRVDRAGVWRSVPMRRGMAVLSLVPGLVAVAGGIHWESLGVLPGLVASGGALLFGVNSWCLDGRGALWRDSLPVEARAVFASRVLVLVEVLLVSTTVTVLVASLRAGVPTRAQLVVVLCTAVVVTLQVVATALRWSVRRPHAVNLRSARATPAPPLAMVGYSARLAVSTTVTALVLTASASTWWLPLVVAVPFLAWSTGKLLLTASAWCDPSTRARVVAVVAS
jgi:hypothetical protein